MLFGVLQPIYIYTDLSNIETKPERLHYRYLLTYYLTLLLYFSLIFSAILFMLGPVVQSVVSLTSSLRVISLTVLADSIYNILIFFAEKM